MNNETSVNSLKITEYIKNNPNCTVPKRITIVLQGKKTDLETFRLPLDLTYYNIKNGRFAAEYVDLVKKERPKKLDRSQFDDDELAFIDLYQRICLPTGLGFLPVTERSEELDKVLHYYKEPHPYYNHDVAVIGAKNSAAIAALELWWTGARVTLIHRGSGISDRVKYWIKPNIENRIKCGEVTAYFHTAVQEIRQHEVALATPKGTVSLKNDFVFAMTGYRPDFEFMAEHGIHLDLTTSKPITDPATLESERPGVYLAGVIVAAAWSLLLVGIPVLVLLLRSNTRHAYGIP